MHATTVAMADICWGAAALFASELVLVPFVPPVIEVVVAVAVVVAPVTKVGLCRAWFATCVEPPDAMTVVLNA